MSRWPAWAEQDVTDAERERLERRMMLAAWKWFTADTDTIEGDRLASEAIDEIMDAAKELKRLGGPRDEPS